ncbi:hypothetical protein ElyMa_000029000 [Elysia marginata]|uniref:Uncharacterized protein n=1 Tax=Elysia marginata TaxID=1093978 RepID=A0AAV4EBP0_9GAST|nr:hypothetical protein ElyMa_000029000 [Elysia marginata]
MWVTVGFTACGERGPECSARSLRQVSPGRREDPDPQQPCSAKRTSGCQDGHLTRTAKAADRSSRAKGQILFLSAIRSRSFDTLIKAVSVL